MVNGAGLAMTTMDLVKRAGGEPANFLDIGGGAKADRVAAAMRLILEDPNVKAILVNIFGGITRGDEVARGLIEARAQQERDVPMVVRIVGTNAAEAAELLEAASFVTAASLDEAAGKAVAAAKGSGGVSILIGRETRLVVQGITGREGEFHSRAMLEYGTASSPASRRARAARRRSTARSRSSTRSPTRSARPAPTRRASSSRRPARPDAILEAVAAGIATIFCITEGIPALDMIPVVEEVRLAGARLIGPNCPGATSPGRAKVGIIPGSIHREGSVGVVSRSGTLTYEAVQAMTDAGIGQSTCVGIGGDPVIGTQFLDVLKLFAADPGDRGARPDRRDRRRGRGGGGRLGGRAPARRPKVAFIAGRTAPEGKRMGHAGAIISGGRGTAASKVSALEAAGIRVAGSPTELPALLREAGYRG